MYVETHMIRNADGAVVVSLFRALASSHLRIPSTASWTIETDENAVGTYRKYL